MLMSKDVSIVLEIHLIMAKALGKTLVTDPIIKRFQGSISCFCC